MVDHDARPALAALLAHLNAHPGLVSTLTGINTWRELSIQPYPVNRGGATRKLDVFADWVRTLCDAVVIKVHRHTDNTLELGAQGLLVDGTPVNVVCLPTEHEGDLLAANTRLNEGDVLPAELLLRLVDHEVAQAVTP